MRKPSPLLTLTLLLGAMLVSGTASAEQATSAQMERVCQNWLTATTLERGPWAESESPAIAGVEALTLNGEVLAHCFRIEPRGFVVVPVLMDLAPVKAWSDANDIDFSVDGGLPQLLRDVLSIYHDVFREAYGGLAAVAATRGDVSPLLDPADRASWDRFLTAPEAFAGEWMRAAGGSRESVGPLLTTVWHQDYPYNYLCPMGDGGRTVVGCVATAVAQVIAYHQWPPVGIGGHSYYWGGDTSCGGSTAGQQLTVDFSDPYDWANMPDDCVGGCTLAERDAVTELCYEVGVAFEMDYGFCGSGAVTSTVVSVLPNYFNYDPAIEWLDHTTFSVSTWFSIIQSEINYGRPMPYRIQGHAIVCDGWRNDLGYDQYHMNYGWGGSHNTWYTIDNLYMSTNPLTEGLARFCMPNADCIFTVRADGLGDFPTIQAGIDGVIDGNTLELEDGTYTGLGNRDLDALGKAFTLRSQSGDPRTCTLDCGGAPGTPTRGFHFSGGETSAMRIEGLTILNGYAEGTYPQNRGAAVLCTNGSGPTLENCVFEAGVATDEGGGVACVDLSAPVLTRCTFTGNTAGVAGGGLSADNATPSVAGCTFVENSAPAGSAIQAGNGSALAVDNSLLALQGSGEPGSCSGGATITLACSDVWNNLAGDYVGCLAGQNGTNGNISLDPEFCDPGNGDYQLPATSPCVPFTAPNPECDLIGAWGVGCGALTIEPDGSGSFATIQAAIDAVMEGVVIELADGTFTGDGNRDLDFHGKAITLRSESGDPTTCIIDCEGSETEEHCGLILENGETAETVVEGITITNGYTDVAGGASLANSSCPTLRNLHFLNNTGRYGGGVRCHSSSSPLVEDCLFAGNEATRLGGGMFIVSTSSPTIRRCTFYGNGAVQLGGGLSVRSGSEPSIENTIVAFSTAGVGVHADGGYPVLSCCDVYGNAGGDWIDYIAAQYGINGNIGDDPLFCDAENGDFTLDSASPCTAAHAPAGCGQMGAFGIGCGDPSTVPGELAGANRLLLRAPSPSSLRGPQTIRFSLPAETDRATLRIYDLTGRLVRTLVDGPQPAGTQQVIWDGTDGQRTRVQSGVFFCRLTWAGQTETRPLVLVR